MSVTFKPAVRANVPLLIGLAGSSGSGKTFSALMLADGIATEMAARESRQPRVFFIDTERGRALHYADDFRFQHGEINPPFRPQAYLDALIAAENAGADVVIIDSFSHCWEGEGGVREWADELEANGAKPPSQWKEPKLAHKKLVNKMLAMRPHIIVCLRAEEKMRVENVPQFNADGSPKMWNGKQSTKMVITPASEIPLKERWVPICEKRFPFEITTSLLLTPNEPGVPIPLKLQRQHQPFFPEGKTISREAGRMLARWAMGEASPTMTTGEVQKQGGLSAASARALLDTAAAQGKDALERAWRSKDMAPFRDELQPDLDGWKQTAIASEATQPKPQTTGASDGYEGV